MFLLLSTGICVWIIYGIKIGSLPVVIANSVSLVFSLIILALKLIYK